MRRIAALFAAIATVSTVLPASALASDPGLGYQVDWTVSGVVRPDGTPRDDDSIAVGDDLHLRFKAVDDTPVTACSIRMFAIGGQLMDTPGAIADGGCELTVRLPDFPDAEYRSRYPVGDVGLDLCVEPMTMTFSDGLTRTLRTLDHLAPAGRSCNDGGGPSTFHAKLDFKVEEGGTPREFVSVPQMLSWNPADWDTGMEPLAFGQSWHYELPSWAETCSPYINGEWVTVVKGATLPGCQPWNVRVPGVLPSSVSWLGQMGTWGWELISEYSVAGGASHVTISAQRTPIAPSDMVFESDRLSVFPVDLASTRFVTVGERWTPVFQVTGGIPLTCRMDRITIPPGWPSDDTIDDYFDGVVDGAGRCSFDIDPMPADAYHQYYINLTWPEGIDGSGVAFGGSISTIPAPEPPVIDPPVEQPGGDTGIGVDPGSGNGLVVDLAVTPDTGSLVAAAAASSPACADRAVSTNLQAGGSIPHLDALCDLAPGKYVATATMIDASGRASTSSRSFTVLVPPPAVAHRSPAAYATGVGRNVRPSVIFDQAVTGVSATTVRLRDVATLAWIPATVSYDPRSRRAILSPTALLGAGRSYKLYVMAGIRNADGRVAAATSAPFRVTTDATAPTFTRSPGANRTGVLRTANIGLTFSETIRGVSTKKIVVRDALTRAPVPATVTWTAKAVTVNPTATLSPNRRYTVSILYGLTDLAGNPVAPTTWSFTTGP